VPARGIGEVTFDRVVRHAADTGRAVLEILARPEEVPGLGRAATPLKEFARLMGDLSACYGMDGTGRPVSWLAPRQGVQHLLEQVIDRSGLSQMWSRQDNSSAIENVNELINFAAEYDRQHPGESGSLTDWLQMISLVADQDAFDPEVGAATLMTLHAAKGLEFNQVFVAGVEDGLLPHERSRHRSSDVEEERRLFFVGMTRARKALTITSAKWRDFRGKTQRTSRSVFLTELPPDKISRLHVGEDGRPVEAGPVEEERFTPSAESVEWRQGQLLRHPSYGVGRLMWVQPRGGRTHVGMQFSAYGEKTFVLEMVRLEEVDETDW